MSKLSCLGVWLKETIHVLIGMSARLPLPLGKLYDIFEDTKIVYFSTQKRKDSNNGNSYQLKILCVFYIFFYGKNV